MPDQPDNVSHEARPVPAGDGSVDLVAELLRSAGRRSAPPENIYRRVLADASAAFDRKLAARRRRRLQWLGVAAAAVAAVAAGWLVSVDRGAMPPAALVLRSSGEVLTQGADGGWRELAGTPSGAAVVLDPGARLRSLDEASLVLELAGGVEVRIDAGSDLSVVDHGQLRLHSGRIYVDTGDQEIRGSKLLIESDAGVVRDIGTRFEVQYRDTQLRLRVRDGQVELSRDGNAELLATGRQLIVSPDGALSRSSFAPYDPYWRWSQTLASPPETHGQPVRVLLDWVARETGRTLRFRDERSRQQASNTILGGNIANALRPMDALQLILPTTDFAFSTSQDGVLELWIKDAVME